MSKGILYCLIGLLVACAGLIGYRCFREDPEALLSVLPKTTDMTLNHIHHVATRDGIKEWVLDAESAQYQKSDNKTGFKDVSVTFFLKDGKTVDLSSSDGVLLTDTRDMEAWNDVTVWNGQYELKTDKLRYEHQTQTISTDTPFVIKGNGMEMTGESMTYNLQTEKATVSGSVKAVFERCTM